ncbi:dimeric alpha-beta barrel [Pyrenophora seminiperda CCB06]|uniref:Dimeric alpha-beta barrel n=1 Tax=Pyrenophora seminiperda CCB06 TaxID=1302712 RepID=A0A3M7MBW9_9PLEO|nr:dimeric alpha-beta barrel [Pyrenophora seminiperda CCB06]
MAISILAFYVRDPKTTPEEFQDYMENHHWPLIKEVFGAEAPLSCTIRYVVRVKTGAGDRLGAPTSSQRRADPNAPVVLVGEPSDLEWDAMSELMFRDELHVQQCLSTLNSPEGQRLKEDEEQFTVPEKLRVVVMGGTGTTMQLS